MTAFEIKRKQGIHHSRDGERVVLKKMVLAGNRKIKDLVWNRECVVRYPEVVPNGTQNTASLFSNSPAH